MQKRDGEINIIENNNAADTINTVNKESDMWKAIMPDGSFVLPGTTNALKYTISHGTTFFSDVYTSPQITGNTATMLESLALIPNTESTSTEYGEDVIWVNSENEHHALRGGDWNTLIN